jgi:hypothetical protein
MRLHSTALLIVTGLAFLIPAAGDDDDRYSRRRNRDYGRGDGYYPPRGYPASSSLVDRVRYNLDRAAANNYVDSHERRHFDRAREELLRFQDRWRSGKFDRGRLDKAIENIADLVQSRQVHPRDRNMLAADLSALRRFRDSGGRDYGYGGPVDRGRRW